MTVKIETIKESKDGITTKYIQILDDGYKIETTRVERPDRTIICYSTQVGCNHGCIFCENGRRKNFKRNMTYDEIFKQVVNVVEHKKTDKQLMFSAMGIGEPLANCPSYLGSVHLLNEKYPNSRFALATCGIHLNEMQLISVFVLHNNIDMKLCISLHSAYNDIRTVLMPSTNLVCDHIDVLLETICNCKKYYKRPIEINITLMRDLNDSKDDANQLCTSLILAGLADDVVVKINRFNPISDNRFQPSEPERVDAFIDVIKKYRIEVKYYETDGCDIGAACGQMILHE